MDKGRYNSAIHLFERVSDFIRKCLFSILSVGPIPSHIAFIMDGNRRYSKKQNLEKGAGHKAGYMALMTMLRYCFELGVKYVTIYAFSIENFKRRPEEVQTVMDLILEKIEELMKNESIVDHYGIRVYFIGNLKLLSEPFRTAAEKVMKSSANNTKAVLLICVAYTSCDEIVHAVQESCKSKREEIQHFDANEACNDAIELDEESGEKDGSVVHAVEKARSMKENGVYNGVTKEVAGVRKRSSVTVDTVLGPYRCKRDQVQALKVSGACNGVRVKAGLNETPIVKLIDIDRHMYMAVAPDPDILIRTSGETRLSNFLLWQTTNCPLYSPSALWPEIGLQHLVWAVLNFQRHHSHIHNMKKLL